MIQYTASIFFITLILSLSSCTQNQSAPQTQAQSNTNISTISSQASSDTLYVDVREDDEWSAGHIEGAIHVKLGDIEAGKVDAIPKDKEIHLYCRSGRRSAIALDALRKLGYTKIQDAGGMTSVQGVTIIQ